MYKTNEYIYTWMHFENGLYYSYILKDSILSIARLSLL